LEKRKKGRPSILKKRSKKLFPVAGTTRVRWATRLMPGIGESFLVFFLSKSVFF
jgi:hypothetical protein